MSFSTRVGLLAGATALTLTGVSQAAGTDDMAQRLAAAEAKIASMEAAQNQNWLTEQRAAEIKGLVQDVLADADTRASLLQAGATSGYDNGFIIGSSDGNWLLRFNFLMQQRAIWNMADETAGGTTQDENRYGFENTRSKLMLSGHIVNSSWFYRWDKNFGSPGAVGVADSRGGGDSRSGNAYLGHDYGNGWKIMMGSMKLPLLREELVEAQYQLAVERSNVNYIFTGGYADGLQVSYEGDQFRFNGMFSDGARTGQTAWGGAAGGPPLHAEWALTGRVEFLASGTWAQFNDFTSATDGENGILIGGAAHWQRSEYGTSGPFSPEMETIILTADISAELGAFNVFAALIYSDLQDAFGVAGADVNPWGFVIQAGYHLNSSWEIFGRYEFTDYDVPGAGAPDDLNIITVGVNKYFAGHNAKWTTDFGYSMDSLGVGAAGSPATITGFRGDVGSEDGQMVLRTQLQLLF